jgi:hypothetical protein
VALGFELMALCLQSRHWQSMHTTAWVIPPVFFTLAILEMGACELFIRAGLQPQSSQPQPPSSWDYRSEPLVPSSSSFLLF